MLGIVVRNDGGTLFIMALICLILVLALLEIYKEDLKFLIQKLFNS